MTPTPKTQADPVQPSNELSAAGRACSIIFSFVIAAIIIMCTAWFAIDNMDKIAAKIVAASLAGGVISILSRLLDHGAFTMNTHARRRVDWWDSAYLAIRVSIGGALGVAAAYVTMAIQAELGTATNAPMLPVIAAFLGGYAFKAQPINLK